MGADGGTGYAEAAAVDAGTIDAAALGREAAEQGACDRAMRSSIDAGDYPVVLEEYAVVDLLDMLGYLGFSRFGRPGGAAASSNSAGGSAATSYSIVDDGRDPAGLPMAFDYEGVAKQRVALLGPGVCRGVVYDAQTAARDGVASTGHGLPAPTRTARSRSTWSWRPGPPRAMT